MTWLKDVETRLFRINQTNCLLGVCFGRARFRQWDGKVCINTLCVAILIQSIRIEDGWHCFIVGVIRTICTIAAFSDPNLIGNILTIALGMVSNSSPVRDTQTHLMPLCRRWGP